jgi:hypothetical protein
MYLDYPHYYNDTIDRFKHVIKNADELLEVINMKK